MRQKWREEDTVREERIDAAIKVEEDNIRAIIEIERKRREEEERWQREEEEQEEAKRKATEEDERQERERQEKEGTGTEDRKVIEMVTAGEDWKYARETLKVHRLFCRRHQLTPTRISKLAR